MGISESLGIARSALQAERLRMDVAANNLANMSSTRSSDGSGPYKRESVLLRTATGAGNFGSVLAGQAGSSPGGVAVDGVTSDGAPPRRVYEPTNPDAGADGYVLYPDIDATVELTDMISASRSYQANVTAINAMKSMAEKALEIGH